MKYIKKQHWKYIGLFSLDAIVFGLTNADTVPSFMMMVAFLLLVATLYYTFRAGFRLVRAYGLTFKRERRIALYLTGVSAGLLALQSIGELGQRDVLILLPLAVLAYLYSSYAKTARL